jgi:hypothetical protein
MSFGDEVVLHCGGHVLELFKASTAHVCRHQHEVEQSIKGEALIMLCVVRTWKDCHWDTDHLC